MAHKKKGYTLMEAVFSLACIAIMLAGVFSVINYMTIVKAKTISSSIMNNYIISVVETIQKDINDGKDAETIDYNTIDTLSSDRLESNIIVYFQNDVYGKPLYLVEIKMRDRQSNNRYTARILLREGA